MVQELDSQLNNGIRILHILSPVKWDGDTFNANADSNWKFTERTIKMLPNCHHYILVPHNHTIKLQKDNISFIRYDYPKSVQLNRGMFDYRQIKFDFTKLDIDFVFNSQPELTYNIQQWLHSNRYYEDVVYFGFYHWIDCNKSRGSLSGCPPFYMRQLESMRICDANFIHSEISLDYSLTLREEKGYKLTLQELDDNFRYFNNIIGNDAVTLNTNDSNVFSEGVLTIPAGKGKIHLIGTASQGELTINTISTPTPYIPLTITKETNGTNYKFTINDNIANQNTGNRYLQRSESHNKIQKLIDRINDKTPITRTDFTKLISEINLIGEPLIKDRLKEMSRDLKVI